MSTHTYSAELDKLVISVKPTVTKLRQRKKVPISAKVIGVNLDTIDELTKLHTLIFPITSNELLDRFQNCKSRVAYSMEYSRVLTLNSKPIGMVLFLNQTYANSVFLFAISIEPSYRNTWATAFLKYETFLNLGESSVKHLLFEAFQNNPDTLSHAEKVGAKKLVFPPHWCG